ncbi:FtsX-like permease family protein [Vagococcus fluvialis]|uniref:FtsX-like permease family protein n=1 Tax=Vagococcus fluvialis TaxID=2738 RepID=A0A7X6D8Y3_9ENTE|nr:FtsX-like permease family protein [Vagococcus fluvialis]NKC67892.1 FtsX-like permease family protein [Vagococcus fluvialis]
MNYFKRGMASITRRKGKSLILFAVIFILGNVMAGAIAIDQGTKSVESTIKKKLGSVATVTMDYEKLDKDAADDDSVYEKMTNPSEKTLNEIGKLDEVSYYDYSYTSFINTVNFKMAQSENENFMMGDGETSFFNLKGVNFNEVLDAKNKIIAINDGRVFEKEEIEKAKNVVLISEQVAKENNVRVGDKIVLDYNSFSGMMMRSDGEEVEAKPVKKDYQAEVIGVFSVLQSEKKSNKKNDSASMNAESNYMDRVNSIYAPNGFVTNLTKETQLLEFENQPEMYEGQTKEEFEKNLDEFNYGQATYTLKSPEVAEDFRINADKILKDAKNKYSKVLISSDQYNQVAGPVKGMSKISKLVLIISILASILIITLVTILFLRDRKHELGIYLSLGEKRSKVVGQIVFEVVVVAFVAITISVFTGNMLAKGFSNSLIQSQKTEQVDNGMGYNMDDYELARLTNSSISEDDVIDAYNISLNPTYILLFYVVGIGVVLVSTVAPLIYIMRLNPKKIMM